MNEFNSLSSSGLNIAEPGVHDVGSSKYPRLTVLKVFRELYLTKTTFKEIGIKYDIPAGLAINIFYSKNHMWLLDKYPKQYAKMKSINRARNSILHNIRNTSSLLIAPDGSVHECDVIKEFARKHNLIPQNLGCVIRKTRASHKGWKLYEG